jgi:hypothetical protein
VPRAELACCRVGDDGDVVAAQLSRAILRLLLGLATRAATSWCVCMARGIGSPRIAVKMFASRGRAACRGPRHVSGTSRVRQRLVVQGGNFPCEADTCRAMRKFAVRGGDLLCEAETARRGSL